MPAICSAHLILDVIILIILGKECKLLRSSIYSFHHSSIISSPIGPDLVFSTCFPTATAGCLAYGAVPYNRPPFSKPHSPSYSSLCDFHNPWSVVTNSIQTLPGKQGPAEYEAAFPISLCPFPRDSPVTLGRQFRSDTIKTKMWFVTSYYVWLVS
jgi:hypothetical protein